MRDQDATVLVNFNREEEIGRLLDQAYTELGKAYYEGGFEDPLPQLLPLFDRITNLKNELEKESAQQPAPAPQPEPVPVPQSEPVPQPEPDPYRSRSRYRSRNRYPYRSRSRNRYRNQNRYPCRSRSQYRRHRRIYSRRRRLNLRRIWGPAPSRDRHPYPGRRLVR